MPLMLIVHPRKADGTMLRGRFRIHLWVKCRECMKVFADHEYANLDDGGGIFLTIPAHRCRRDSVHKQRRLIREIRQQNSVTNREDT